MEDPTTGTKRNKKVAPTLVAIGIALSAFVLLRLM